MPDKGDGRYAIRAVDRVCDLLDALRVAVDGVTLTELAEAVGLPKSSVLRYLSTLETRRYVHRVDGEGVYRLGVAFRPDHAQWLEAAQHAAVPRLAALRDVFGETTHLSVLEGASMLHVQVAEAHQAVRLVVARGQRSPLHTTAVGKAAATLVTDQVVRQALAATGMRRVSEFTLTTPDAFLDSVARCRRDGFALEDCENQPDGRGAAVPLPGLPLPAAVGVSAPAFRFSRARSIEVGDELRGQIRSLARDLAALPT